MQANTMQAQNGQAHNGQANTVRQLALAFALIIAPGFLGSCVSNRLHQQAMDDKDAEIRKLREERTALKEQMQSLHGNLQSAQGELANASAKTADTPEPAPSPKSQEKIPELDALGVGYGERNGHTVITIPSAISFASGQAELSKEGQKALKEVAVQLKKKFSGARLSIDGHTDDEPIKKSKFSSNRELSVARAMAVLTFLVTECNVPDEQCIVAGHSQYDPIAKGKGKEDLAKNRRVEIVVLKH
jgi:chemotaxis protein MotB